MTESVLNELVGEGKKFATVEDLAKGKLESDSFIAKIQTENKDLRDLVTGLGSEVEKLKTKATFVEKLNGKSGDTTTAKSGEVDTTQPKVLTEEDVSNILSQRELAQRAADNKAKVDSVLLKQFGAEAKNFVKDQAESLGMSVEDLVGLAERNPSLFYRAVGLNPDSSSSSLPGLKSGSHSNVKGLGNDHPEKRGAQYWEKKRKEVGSWKFATNKELNIQMHKDMRTLGDDWNKY